MNPREYEDLVHKVCADLGREGGVTVHRAIVFTGRISGRKIAADVSFEATILGARVLGIVECKYYKARVQVSDVEEFDSKLRDIGAHKGIIFTTVGYQAGAKQVAEGRGIGLFILGDTQQGLRIEKKSFPPRKTSSSIRGVFFPHGTALRDREGFAIESVGDFFYSLAFSDVARFEALEKLQGGA